MLSEIFSLLCTKISIDYLEESEPIVDDDESEDFSDEDCYCETIGFSTIDATSTVLSQVCSTWNNVLSNSTYAWSTIHVQLRIEDEPPLSWVFAQDMRKIGNALTCALNRSEGLPLHVSLNYHWEGDACMRPEVLAILRCLLGQNHRWKTADIRLAVEPKNHQVLSQLCAPMPTLEALTFSLKHLGSAAGANEINNFFCQTPALRTATFRCPQAFQRSKLNWADLHTIEIEVLGLGIQMSHIKKVLSQCKALRSLTWSSIVDNSANDDTHPVVLPITAFRGSRDIATFLPHFLLPDISIFDLTISYAYSDEDVFPESLDGYRSVITSLHVNSRRVMGRGHSVETIFAQLGSFPALNSLELGQYSAYNEPASDFGKIPRRFPKLKKLSCSISGDVTASILNNILSLLEAFKRPTGVESSLLSFPILRTVHLHFLTAYLDEERRSMLRTIRDNGLCLEVRDKLGLLNLSGSNESWHMFKLSNTTVTLVVLVHVFGTDDLTLVHFR